MLSGKQYQHESILDEILHFDNSVPLRHRSPFPADVRLRHGHFRQEVAPPEHPGQRLRVLPRKGRALEARPYGCCECLFNWYWLADACHAAGIQFVLAHALYLNATHGGKNKNDRIDSEKLTHLLRSNLIPPSYVYPSGGRPIRALFRQRMSYVWQHTELLQRAASMQMAEGKQLAPHKNCSREKRLQSLLENFPNEHQRFGLESDVCLIAIYDEAINDLEKELLKITRRHRRHKFNLLRTVTGIGKTLALTILYEIDTIERFPTVQRFCSYCRVVKGTVASAGKIKGLRGTKLGKPLPALGLRRGCSLGQASR